MTRLTSKALFPIIIVLFTVSVWMYIRDSHRILQQKITSWSDDNHADCAVVLTGGPGRISEGFSLLAQGRVRKLIISGVYSQADLRGIFPQLPFYGSVDRKDVILEKRSLTTYGNAQQSLPLVQALNCRDVILVTSRTHMYRSLRTFRAVYPAEIPIYPRAILSQHLKPGFWELFFETLKTMFYDLWAY